MKSFIAIAAFAAGTNALVGRSDSCCFHLTSSGGASGSVGELGDGQVRVGDNKLSTAQFCIDSTGAITDGAGRGCIITSPTTQFQCDLGANATTGFSVSSSGQLEYHGSPNFVACETGDNGGLNFYTTNSSDVTQCKNVNLNADSCSGSGSGSGSGAGAGSSSSPKPSVAPTSSASGGVPVSSGSPAPHSSGAPGGVSVSSGLPAPSGAPSSASPSNSAPLSGSPIYVTSTVTVTDCSCPNSVPAGSPAPTPSQGTPSAGGGGGGGGGGSPAPSGSPAPHSSGAPGGAPVPSGSPSPHTSSVPGVIPVPSGSPAPHTSSVPSVVPVPSGSPSHSSGAPAGGGGSSSSASSPASSSQPTISTSTFVATSTVAASSPGSSAGQSSSSATATQSSSGSCATTLIDTPGQYQYPHLIVPVNSSSPDTAAGTQYFGTVSSTVSTIFNFDVPSSWKGSSCNLVFMFPQKADLETSDYTFTGDGKIDITQLSDVATSSTTWNSVPAVSQNLGDITISPGNTYVVSTFSCPAGETVAYEMSEAGSTYLHFFEDWNPSPLGLFMTKC